MLPAEFRRVQDVVAALALSFCDENKEKSGEAVRFASGPSGSSRLKNITSVNFHQVSRVKFTLPQSSFGAAGVFTSCK